MISYSKYSLSLFQKSILIFLEVVIIYISYLFLFNKLPETYYSTVGLSRLNDFCIGNMILFISNILLFVTYLPTIFIFVKRKIVWSEAVSLHVAFSIYYIGFALFGYGRNCKIDIFDIIGIIILLTGLILHFLSEYQRHKFKTKPENKARLMTSGLWQYSRHFNYFADLLWVTGYVLITHNCWSIIIVIVLFTFFYFFNY